MTSTSPAAGPLIGLVPPDSRLDAASRRLAEGISQLVSPPVVAAGMIALASARAAASGVLPAQAWLWGLGLALMAVAAPLLYLRWLVRVGRVSEMDVRRRHQRLRPMAFALAAGMAALCTLEWGGAPLFLCLVASLLWLLMAGLMAVSVRWKISVHTAMAGAGLALLWACCQPAWAVGGLLLVGWARVRLGCHTVAQVAAGSAWGLALFIVGVALYGG
jgi:hypothetical protein